LRRRASRNEGKKDNAQRTRSQHPTRARGLKTTQHAASRKTTDAKSKMATPTGLVPGRARTRFGTVYKPTVATGVMPGPDRLPRNKRQKRMQRKHRCQGQDGNPEWPSARQGPAGLEQRSAWCERPVIRPGPNGHGPSCQQLPRESLPGGSLEGKNVQRRLRHCISR
jgi:hypothetical protein